MLVTGCAQPRYGSTYAIGSETASSASEAEVIMVTQAAITSAHPEDPSRPPLRLLKGMPPEMPREAIDRGVVGRVGIQAVFDESGRVESVRVLNPAPELLANAVIEAVSQWRIEPRLVKNKPSKVIVRQTFEFRVSK